MTMKIVLLEGFDYYLHPATQPGDMNTRWSVAMNTGALVFNTGLGGDGQCLSMNNAGFGGFNSIAFEAAHLLTFHFALRIDSPFGAANSIFQFCDPTSGNAQFGIAYDFAGHLQIRNGANNTNWLTSAQALQVGHAYRCCLQVDLTGGNVHLSINGTVDTGMVATGDARFEALTAVGLLRQFKGDDSQAQYSIDDLILGINACVDWGPQEISTRPATSDVAVQWTRSGGANNFGNVDDIPFTAEADYNSSSTVGQKDIFGYGVPPHTPDAILCVGLVNISRKEESAVRKFKDLLHIGGTDYLGDEHNLDEAYNHWGTIWQTNPATAAAWVPTDFPLQGGYVLTEVD